VQSGMVWKWMQFPCTCLLPLVLVACQRPAPPNPEQLTADDMARLYGPAKIEVLPFTSFRSFDDDAIPDGIEVTLRPLDELGDPVKVFGTFIFELYPYQVASGHRAGPRLECWTQVVADAAAQRQFWDRVTSTYVFQLVWEGGEFPAVGRKYRLEVTYQGPGGKRLFGTHDFEFTLSRGRLREDLRREPGGELGARER
jgi:hypothetical protein